MSFQAKGSSLAQSKRSSTEQQNQLQDSINGLKEIKAPLVIKRKITPKFIVEVREEVTTQEAKQSEQNS